uniref:Tubulin-tyrosine ligase family protein n=1 Tax=Chromera velia CCMP2878 TaxID=1169474 RepID=A0A0G4FCG4_9ALVE|eukprot:Cvel_16362.t1-p1 / transcript=Cvel_16362.t1 / gene=Cvel_16362 / organism=Chromera_velia_CCMP2878 / gene_product=Tubulin polyglutamylase ttll6, putative / transcript_product=Tubulin polyglutamylase ttll6, putative / location=Cvel_scaffold1257:7194-10013(-) / protein_length=496 / sequence_SO=supercontig / SO=protein_coding / is_pseudo=false
MEGSEGDSSGDDSDDSAAAASEKKGGKKQEEEKEKRDKLQLSPTSQTAERVLRHAKLLQSGSRAVQRTGREALCAAIARATRGRDPSFIRSRLDPQQQSEAQSNAGQVPGDPEQKIEREKTTTGPSHGAGARRLECAVSSAAAALFAEKVGSLSSNAPFAEKEKNVPCSSGQPAKDELLKESPSPSPRLLNETIDVFEGGTKVSLATLRKLLEARGVSWAPVWTSICEVVLKCLCCCGDFIPHQANSFELFGFDVLIDSNKKPWLIEVNSSPSLSTDTTLDEEIKAQLIRDTIELVDPPPFDRLKLVEVLSRRCPKIPLSSLRSSSHFRASSNVAGLAAFSASSSGVVPTAPAPNQQRTKPSPPPGNTKTVSTKKNPPESSQETTLPNEDTAGSPFARPDAQADPPKNANPPTDVPSAPSPSSSLTLTNEVLSLLGPSAYLRTYGETPRNPGQFAMIAPGPLWTKILKYRGALFHASSTSTGQTQTAAVDASTERK